MRFNPLRRREFITLLGGAAAAWPPALSAQQPQLPVIEFLNGASPATWAHLVAAFQEGPNATGYVEHRNVGIEYRCSFGRMSCSAHPTNPSAIGSSQDARPRTAHCAVGQLQAALTARAACSARNWHTSLAGRGLLNR